MKKYNRLEILAQMKIHYYQQNEFNWSALQRLFSKGATGLLPDARGAPKREILS